jgi:endo-1,4-beta-xylanase
VRGPTLVWHSQNPAWLTEAAFTPAQLRDILRKHIFDETGHFRG